MADKLTVMISSTAQDLPVHRKEVMDACLRQGMFPIMMEHLPASGADAITESLCMVDEADIYLGILAHRYGYVPAGYDVSITEMEVKRAIDRNIPCLIFFMHDDHPVKIAQVDKGEGAVKLDKLKQQLQANYVVNFFDSPADLRAKVIDSLSRLPQKHNLITAFHSMSDIPHPPNPYIAHPYTLLQTSDLIGRRDELSFLTDWVTEPASKVYNARILNIVAMGGTGKSALTWKWFNDIAPLEMKPLAGRMWWSFYESDANMENFIIRALAYVTQRSRQEIERLQPLDRENELLSVLNYEPYLLVLDGLERVLVAYSRMDAARLKDDDLDQETSNAVAGAFGLPPQISQNSHAQHRLRQTTDHRAGKFLRKLAHVKAARILVSTRLYPLDLQTTTGSAYPGSFACFLRGLCDNDALDLWRASGVTGSRESLLPLFHTFENHALLIQILSGEVARDRRVPGDFERWRQFHPDFNPFNLPLVQTQSHVLAFALKGLDNQEARVLSVLSAFRMPANYDALVTMLVGDGKPLKNELSLDIVLTELEDRGLVGWDRYANRYDLHPIVRGVTWNSLTETTQRGIYEILRTYFESLSVGDETITHNVEDLAPIVELYNVFIGLREYDKAWILFFDRLASSVLRLSAIRYIIELLELLFPEGPDRRPYLSDPNHQAGAMFFLAMGYEGNGSLWQVMPLYRRAIELSETLMQTENMSGILGFSAHALYLSGFLYRSELNARRALILSRKQKDRFQEAINLYWFSMSLFAQGRFREATIAYERVIKLLVMKYPDQSRVFIKAASTRQALYSSNLDTAQTLASEVWDLASERNYERDFISSAQLQGLAAQMSGNLTLAEERFSIALARARVANLVEEELQTLVKLAVLQRHKGDIKYARELLTDLSNLAQLGPYPLVYADALNVLTDIELDEGNNIAALDAATKAYKLAWCDGPPYAYYSGLEAARKRLYQLGAQEPFMSPFDDTKYEPMPGVEINPRDEFYVIDGGET